MSKEEPAWKAELKGSIHSYFDEIEGGSIWYLTGRLMEALEPHIRAAEQRGFQAGVNKTGDSVGKLREQLKTARANAFREAAEAVDTDDEHPRGCALDCYVCGAKADARMLRKMADKP